MTKGVFSEFEVKEQYIKIGSGETATFESMSCVGTSEEELDVVVVTKKCRGVKEKERVRGAGSGKLTESLHVPYDIYNKMYNMTQQNLAEGVAAYGKSSMHPEFALTQLVEDEDGAMKYKAYPRCILESGPKRPVENGATEVPELSLIISLLPDDNGNCMYEILESKATEEMKTKWLTEFTPALVKVPNA